MIRNFLTTAIKVFTRNKAFTAINILGLSIGISAALLIFLMVNFELGYDQVQPDADRIYRVVMDLEFDGNEGHSAAVPAPLSVAADQELTGIEASVPVLQFQGDGTVQVSIDQLGVASPSIIKKQAGIVFTNANYFALLPFTWLAGNPATSLKDPFQVVITESRAKQYFATLQPADVVGRQLNYNGDVTATVTGVVKDMDARTSFTAMEFISYASIAETSLQKNFMMNVWNDWMAYSSLYIKLKPGVDVAMVSKQFNKVFIAHNSQAYKDEANYTRLQLQPLREVHFDQRYSAFDQRLAHKPTLYGLLAVGIFLLLLACINFINLTTANAASRAKEIGIRKTMGSSRRQLVWQFLGETFLLTSIACLVSFCMLPFLFQGFRDFLPPGLHFTPLAEPVIFLFLFLLAVVVSLFSGFYPALVLSGYKPVKVLKNLSYVANNETRHAWIRKSLTVSQFVIAQFFVIATVLVSKQINYSINTDLGFRKDAVLSFNGPRRDTVKGNRAALLNEIQRLPGVQLASRGFMAPADEGAAFVRIRYAGSPGSENMQVQTRSGDGNYLKLFDIPLVAGRNVSANDSIKELLINETYGKMLGFQQPKDAIGIRLVMNDEELPVVGVMRDFHEQSFRGVVGPMVFANISRMNSTYHVLLQPNAAGVNNWPATILQLQQLYQGFYPDAEFNYTFLDESIARFYANEQRTASLLRWATILTIVISCLGLLGLVMYTIHTRMKEIGIRKILGAGVASIVSILSKDFVKLVMIAFAIAVPIAWWATQQWLQNFVYRTSMSWWIYLLCGIVMLLLALFTLGIQTVRAALANPVKSIRNE